MSSEDKPKIIVDDDWKSRVQAEKEALKAAESAPDSEKKASTDESSDREAPGALPPASFESLVSLFVTQALAALGQIPMGENQQPVIMLDHAKHYIDLLAILETKTKGNLSQDESEMLTQILHELRMLFVALQKHAKNPSTPK